MGCDCGDCDEGVEVLKNGRVTVLMQKELTVCNGYCGGGLEFCRIARYEFWWDKS